MTTLFLASEAGPLVVRRGRNGWAAVKPLDVSSSACIAADPLTPRRVFCSSEEGIWRSDDGGTHWERVFKHLPHPQVTSLSVSPVERVDGLGVSYLGTEPSGVFRSQDGGQTWQECVGLTDLSSSDEWSFPPRPQTHHVRWIQSDPHDEGRIYVAIEAGALVFSPDGGQTWKDRAPDGPYDTHQLATHALTPGWLWSAAGDGFFQSQDYGAS